MLSCVSAGTFECDGLVIGATLGGLDFARKNNLPVLTNGKVVYYDYEETKAGRKLQDKAANEKIYLSMRGLMIFPYCEKIFLRDEYFSIISQTSSQKLYFKKAYLFNADEIENLKKTIVDYEVVDIIKRKYLSTPQQKVYETGEKNFITRIRFDDVNLLYAYSNLTKQQLNSHENTEFMAKKKVGWWLKQNGYRSHVKGNYIKLHHQERLKRPNYKLFLPDNIEDRTNG